MTNHRRLIGLPGQPHTGVESRALRASLNLERRHVVALANAVALYPDDVTTSQVTSWERGKPGGYPEALTTAMEAIAAAVREMAGGIIDEGMRHRAKSIHSVGLTPEGPQLNLSALPGSTVTLRRPLGGKRVLMLLDLGAHGLTLDQAALDVLDQGGGDFWQALADAAITRAVLSCEGLNHPVRVMLDREAV